MKINFVFGILISLGFLFAIGFASAVQYGMMGDNGQFVPVNNYNSYGGMMGMMQMMTGYGGYGYGSGIMFLGWIIYLLVIALIIAAIYWLVKSANRKK